MSFADLCARVGADCVEDVEEVSRLRHAFEWSMVSASDGEYSFTLTSLSVHNSASQYSLSYFVASASDVVVRAKLGVICDWVQIAVICFNAAVRLAQADGPGMLLSATEL